MGTLPKVLVIDDGASFIAFISALVRAAGYAPVVAFDAMQGLMFAQREGPTVILLDLNMPAGGGMRLLERLQKPPKAQGVPVIIVTATTFPGLEADAKSKGAAGLLTKPVDKDALIGLLQQMLA
jgi:two-component system response regulator (stage 0 sporulation protein F)